MESRDWSSDVCSSDLKIYKELLEHPKTGLGHPEALRGGGDITCLLYTSSKRCECIEVLAIKILSKDNVVHPYSMIVVLTHTITSVAHG